MPDLDTLAVPRRHVEVDGSRMLRHYLDGPTTSFSGRVRHVDALSRVPRSRRVVEFEENLLIAWRHSTPSTGASNCRHPIRRQSPKPSTTALAPDPPPPPGCYRLARRTKPAITTTLALLARAARPAQPKRTDRSRAGWPLVCVQSSSRPADRCVMRLAGRLRIVGSFDEFPVLEAGAARTRATRCGATTARQRPRQTR